MRSVAVVFPASMCAMIPMFRQRFRGMVRATAVSSLRAPGPRLVQLLSQRAVSGPWPLGPRWLPAVMRKGLVGLGHAVHIFLLLHRRAAPVGGIEQLIAQLVDHALFAAVAAVGDQPADGQRGAPLRVHFDRNLVVGAAHAAGLD